jgi:hypothetical protein
MSELSACHRGYYLQNQHKRGTSMPSAGLEPMILEIERPQTYVSDRPATGQGDFNFLALNYRS